MLHDTRITKVNLNTTFLSRPICCLSLCLISMSLILVGAPQAFAVSTDPVRADNGMVVAAHPVASEAGIKMLEKGSNAVDAAVAAALVAGVVEPYSAGIGGGGFMLVYLAGRHDVVVIDYRETAPRAAYRDMYLDDAGNIIPDASLVGHRAAGTPGTVAGLCLAVEQYGSLPFAVVAQPAIHWAEEGFPAYDAFIEKAKSKRSMLERFDETARLFLSNGGELFKAGDLVVQKDLARTLRRIAEQGASGFYDGPVARAIAAEMKAHGGLITEQDLAGYAPRMRKPIRGRYRGFEVVTMPPPSSGGTHLVQMLNILEAYDLKTMGYGSVDAIHVMAEAMRRAYADRAEFLGDPAFANVPVKGLTSKEYAAALRATIDPKRAGTSSEIGPGEPRRYQESDHTTHISVVDNDGNAVSMTQTINSAFGCGVVVPGTGVLLNNEMDDFSAKPGTPNLYGLVGKEANAVAPGKIPLSSMTPTLVFKGGRLMMVVGSPGGSRIITTVLQVIINVVDHGMGIAQAIASPRIHHQWLPDELQAEPGAFQDAAIQTLEAFGHRVVRKDRFGNAMGIVIDHETHELSGTADPRGVGAAVGY